MYKQLKEVGVWAGGCCDCDNYRLSQKQSISTAEMYYKICAEWHADHYGRGLK